jgi:hypothetical protein
VGPPESVTGTRKSQAAGRRKRRPRQRYCLLKGCEGRFHARHAGQRYCSTECREKARKWRQWKAQQRYRSTDSGKQKRKGQSQRYRERVKTRRVPEIAATNQSARVIGSEHFFRAYLRPAGVLRALRTAAAKSLAALLFACMPPRSGASCRTGAALETGAHLIRTY